MKVKKFEQEDLATTVNKDILDNPTNDNHAAEEVKEQIEITIKANNHKELEAQIRSLQADLIEERRKYESLQQKYSQDLDAIHTDLKKAIQAKQNLEQRLQEEQEDNSKLIQQNRKLQEQTDSLEEKLSRQSLIFQLFTEERARESEMLTSIRNSEEQEHKKQLSMLHNFIEEQKSIKMKLVKIIYIKEKEIIELMSKIDQAEDRDELGDFIVIEDLNNI